MTILQKLYCTGHLRQFCRKSWTVGQLDKLDTPLFFRLKYYYHWLSMSYNNYYLKYVPVQLVQLSNLSNFHIVFSMQTLAFIGVIFFIFYKYLISLRIGMVKSADPIFSIWIKNTYANTLIFMGNICSIN